MDKSIFDLAAIFRPCGAPFKPDQTPLAQGVKIQEAVG
jgi:hypothetical protein